MTLETLSILYFMTLSISKKCTTEPYSILVIDATVASDSLLRFRKNLLEKIQKIIMTIDGKIRDEKPKYDIYKKAIKISALSSGKVDKYECLAGEEILSSEQRRVIGQATFKFSRLGKALEKQIKTIKDQGEKQIKRLENRAEKNFFRHRSKINRLFVPKRFSKWRSYIRIKQNCGNGK